MDVHIAAIEYTLAERWLSVEDLDRENLLESRPDALRGFGFDRAYVAGVEADALASRAVERLLDRTGTDPESIDRLFYAGATPASHSAGGTDLLAGFSYPVARLQYTCDLVNARTIGISQTGCLGLMTAVSLARSLLVADPSLRRTLCVSADVLPAGAPREILYNVISDGSCAVLVERGSGPNRILTERQVTKGYYWHCAARKNEIVAAYFPTACAVIRDALAAAGLTLDEVAWVLPHNVSLRSWEILLQLVGLPLARLYADNIAAKGHVIGGDNFINLKDAQDHGRLRRGDRLLLFNFGFGASWAALLLEH